MNGDFLLDVSVKLFYTDDICPLISKLNSYYHSHHNTLTENLTSKTGLDSFLELHIMQSI
jgi:hypothetical protein